MYAGKLKQSIPTGPGTFFRKNDSNIFVGEWMGNKSDGHTRWSFGERMKKRISSNIILESINWLEYMQKSERLRKSDSEEYYQIRHFFRGGEKRFIDNESIVYVDGYAENDDASETWIFEFLGCQYHYCENCGSNLNKRKKDEDRER